MTAVDTEVPWYYYPAELARFRKDTEHHEVEILLDQGLYRHVRFSQPEHRWLYWYDLITWPGHLTIRGDMGTFVFARVEDMFGFFAGDHINADYWAEKLQASEIHGGHQEYSPTRFKRLVTAYVDDRADHLSAALLDTVRGRVAADLFSEDVVRSEDEARGAVADFHVDGFEFVDAWEWELQGWTPRYLWCLHAIQQGIARYRAAVTP